MYGVLVPYGISIFLFKRKLTVCWLLAGFSSPMGYLYFYSGFEDIEYIVCDNVLVPYGVSIFLFYGDGVDWKSKYEFSSPMGYLYFYSNLKGYMERKHISSRPLWGIHISIQKFQLNKINIVIVLVPYGVSIFLFLRILFLTRHSICSRPLWGIYISILAM